MGTGGAGMAVVRTGGAGMACQEGQWAMRGALGGTMGGAMGGTFKSHVQEGEREREERERERGQPEPGSIQPLASSSGSGVRPWQ